MFFFVFFFKNNGVWPTQRFEKSETSRLHDHLGVLPCCSALCSAATARFAFLSLRFSTKRSSFCCLFSNSASEMLMFSAIFVLHRVTSGSEKNRTHKACQCQDSTQRGRHEDVCRSEAFEEPGDGTDGGRGTQPQPQLRGRAYSSCLAGLIQAGVVLIMKPSIWGPGRGVSSVIARTWSKGQTSEAVKSPEPGLLVPRGNASPPWGSAGSGSASAEGLSSSFLSGMHDLVQNVQGEARSS